MKEIINIAAIVCAALVPLASVADAVYIAGASGSQENTANRLVVKLRTDIAISAENNQNGALKTGIQELDNLCRSHRMSYAGTLFEDVPASRADPRFKNIIILETGGLGSLSEAARDFQSLADVEYAFPDESVQLYDSPDDSLYVHQWALNNIGQGCYHVERHPGQGDDVLVIEAGTPDADIDADEVYQNPPDHTSTVIVAIVDTGVDMDHPDLSDNIWVNPGEIPDNGIDDDHNGYIDDVNGWDFAGDSYLDPPDNEPSDTYGHGTHCSGIVAAMTNNSKGIAGILPDCYIMPLSFYPMMLTSWAAEAIVYAADNGADVINMSWGLPYEVPLWEDALDYAREKGVILCAAAGNDGGERINFPAGYDNNIAVSASTKFDEVAFFSTFGSNIRVCAPGYSILSLRAEGTDMYGSSEAGVHIIDNYYFLASGTSMAAPHVTGVAAYLRAASPGLTVTRAYEIIEQSADDLIDPLGNGGNYPGWDIYSGYGRLNLNQALAMAPDITAILNSPVNHQIVSGTVQISGTADGAGFENYVLEYGQGQLPSEWTEIAASTSPVAEGLLGEWNTAGMDGPYTLRLRVGEFNEKRVTVYVTNNVVVDIFSPEPDDTIQGYASIVGTASCPDFDFALLEFGPGGSPTTWTEIAQISQPVFNDEIATWSVGGLAIGTYTVRLSLNSINGLEGSASVTVSVSSAFAGDAGWKVTLPHYLTIAPNYGDFDDDGENEIVLGTDSGVFYFAPDGTQKTEGMPSLPPDDFSIPIPVGNLDGDGIDDHVAISASTDDLYILYGDGTQTVVALPVPADAHALRTDIPSSWPVLCLVDVNQDELDEIVYCPGNDGWDYDYYIFTNDGQPWGCAFPIVEDARGSFIAADINGDQACEFYYSDATRIVQVDSCGQEIASAELASGNESLQAKGVSAYDIDFDGIPELILFGFAYIGPDLFDYQIWAFDENLQVKDGWPHDTGINGFYIPRHPVFGDLNGDGDIEYVVSFWDLSDGFVYAWNIDGTPFVGLPDATGLFAQTSSGAAVSLLLMADLNEDHAAEIISCQYPATLSTYEDQAAVAWDYSGEMLDGWPMIASTEVGAIPDGCNIPVVGDLDQDGSVDFFMTTVNGELVFTEFDDVSYNRLYSPCPQWKYSRKLNGVKEPLVPGFTECGDADGSGSVDIDDAVFLIEYIFSSGNPPLDERGGDVDCSGFADIDDVVYLILYIFSGGPAPCEDCP